MADFDNTNRGVIFVNDKKAEGSKQPDRTGSINIEGVEYFLDGWLKISQAGAKFMSLSVKRKEVQPQRQEAPRAAPARTAPAAKPAPAGSGFDDMDDDIPF